MANGRDLGILVKVVKQTLDRDFRAYMSHKKRILNFLTASIKFNEIDLI